MTIRNDSNLPLKPYTMKELALLYGVCKRTFKKWLQPYEREIGNHNGRFLTIVQVKIIFSKLGLPSTTIIDD